MDESEERVKKIGDLQNELGDNVKKAEVSLFELLLSYWSAIRDNPAAIRRIFKQFETKTYSNLVKDFAFDIKTIVALNEEYFIKTASTTRMTEITKIVGSRIDERLGLEATGEIITGGYMDTIVKDQTTKRQVQNFFYRTQSLKNETRLRNDLRDLVKGVNEEGGVVSKFFDNYVFDTYQEADRLAQNDYAQSLDLPAAIYTGGLIDGSRPFCVARNRKVFLREEIELFGTSADKFGGYSDKATGKFNGKPKDGYDPFTQCGGHRCRHHWSWISALYAIRLDPTLKLEGDKLIRQAA